MARKSKKSLALEAAFQIIDEEGIESVTFDALSEKTGLSKSGLVYHFPSRHHLLAELHRECATRWETSLEEASGGRKAHELSRAEKSRALVESINVDESSSGLLLNIHAVKHPAYGEPWDEVDARWLPDPSIDAETEEEISLIEQQLLTVGLWTHDHLSGKRLSVNNRRKVMDRLLARIEKREAEVANQAAASI